MRRALVWSLGLFFVSLMTALSPAARAADGETYLIVPEQATVFATPDESKPLHTRLKGGRRVQSTGEMRRGFLRLSTKSGAAVWIRVSDVRAEASTATAGRFDEGDLTEPRSPTAPHSARRSEQGGAAGSGAWVESDSNRFGVKAVTFDIGASGGSYNDVTYTEINLGVNTYFSRFLAWRNAGFGRFQSGADNVYGLDTSARLVLGGDLMLVGATIFGGPGYRFVTKGDNTPFLEAGAILKVGPFSLGGGLKTLTYSWVSSERRNDTQYFFILAGGGSL